ncbi:ATP-dependent DNA helicase Q4 [Kryptolebias marmoratus]|uniref:ATP-dependent DNA helicase Q4 n=1 Tax=Kryptolebias marmoratus TaxID=37003 RepID=UPI0007F92A83|nr:ATP-dependent DNA helicase Q4 [Kryptolebias marmoratus]
MDRYNEVKTLLKGWEQGFVRQHQRKPNKEDIDRAPEETRNLYKEYKSLKQAKENSSTDASSNQTKNTTQLSSTYKESDCWGAHLNRKAMPVSAPKLTSQDRDNLMASSQYYGLKLKSNLVALSKERLASLKKPHRTGRVPLNSLTDCQTPSSPSSSTETEKTPAVDRDLGLFSPRGMKPCQGLLPSKLLRSGEPEEKFKPFEPVPDAVSSCSNTNSDGDSKDISSKLKPTSTTSPPTTSSALLLSLSPQHKFESTEKLIKSAGDREDGSHMLESPHRSPDPGPSASFSGGLVKRPSLANRLSFVDRKWLERCQVFGEMEAEERPGGGNQEIKMETREKKEQETEAGRAGKDEKDEDGERRELKDFETEERFANDVPKSARQHTGKSKGEGERKGKRNKDEEMERGEAELAAPGGDGESRPKSQSAKKRSRKRQREGDNTEGSSPVEEGVKKKRRNRKMKEENSVNSNDGGGQKKRRAKRKEKDHEEEDEEKETKVPTKVPQENLFGEMEDEFRTNRTCQTQPVRARVKGAEGNFVKINLKKKSHVKGYALRGMALRKQLYMQKFQLKGERFGGGGGHFGRGRRGGFRGGLSRQGDTCFKCGGTGHWAMDCRGPAPPPPVSEEQSAEEEPFELPTLEDVARATGTLRPHPLVASPCVGNERQEKEENSSCEDDVLLNLIRPDYERPAPPPPVQPLYHLTEDGRVQETPDEVCSALRALGYQSFRPGQEKAIMRILSGLSTLVVLSTGMGKSLCYQLPAYLYAQRSKCITLVISPLVSLMDDQLSGIPTKLKAACIHSNMTMKQREAVIEKVKSGQVCVLLLSPEALVGGGGSGAGCLPSAQELPPVAFACIDEAHCVSEWSHNFRPCYLRLCKVLRERLGVRCLLGLTATATLSTALDIAHHLDISDQDGIAVRSAAVPPNLNLSVSTHKEKDQALVSLLKGDRFGCLDSVIVYCTRREETVRVAALLRTCLQGVLLKENTQTSSESKTQNNSVDQRKKELARKKIRKPLKWQAEAYHAGLSGAERRRVQNNFMCGELRIVVATVAFGMGLDKSDVRGIIHYNMPKSFESYVQEIGRAGRDGEPAHCHLFLDPEGGDLHELRRHIYADTVDYYTVKKLVQRVFPACKCKKIHQKQQELWEDMEDSELLEVMDVCDQERHVHQPAQQDTGQTENKESTVLQMLDQNSGERVLREVIDEEKEKKEEDESKTAAAGKEEEADWPKERVCHTHEQAIPIQETVEALDITEEGVETLLCYLELHPQRFVELLHPTLSVCTVKCYEGPRQLQKITKICPPVAVALVWRRMAGERVLSSNQLEFDVVKVADTMGWQLPVVKRGLRQLQWSTDRGGGRSGIHVEFSSPSFHFRSYGDLSDEEMDRVCQFLHDRVQEQERTQLFQLTACFKAFKSVAFKSVTSCVDDLDESRSLQLKNLLSEYFDQRRDRDHTLEPLDLEELNKYKLLDWEDQIRADIRSFLSCRSDERFSGRAVARVFHGIGSPCYPAQIYGKDRRFWRKYIQFDFNQLIRIATQEILHFK